MIGSVRPLGLSIKSYATLLATISMAGFVAGGAINFVYARNNPGADPYKPQLMPRIIVPLNSISPNPEQKAKTLPTGDAPAQPPLISGITPGPGTAQAEIMASERLMLEAIGEAALQELQKGNGLSSRGVTVDAAGKIKVLDGCAFLKREDEKLILTCDQNLIAQYSSNTHIDEAVGSRATTPSQGIGKNILKDFR